MPLLCQRTSRQPWSLLPVEHLHEHFLNIDTAYDWFEEQLGDYRRADGPQHGEGDEQLGKAGGVLVVDQPDVFVQSLVRLPAQGLDVVEAA